MVADFYFLIFITLAWEAIGLVILPIKQNFDIHAFYLQVFYVLSWSASL